MTLSTRNLAITVLLLSATSCGSPDNERSFWHPTAKVAEVEIEAPVMTQAEIEAENAEYEKARQKADRVAQIRQKNTELNWVWIGLTTGKFSESMDTIVFKTYDQCSAYTPMSENECIPIRALPQSYWDAEKVQ